MSTLEWICWLQKVNWSHCSTGSNITTNCETVNWWFNFPGGLSAEDNDIPQRNSFHQSHVSASGHSLMLLLRLLRSYGMKNESYTISVAAHGCPRQLLRLLRLPCSTTIAYVRVSCSAVSTALPPARVGHHSKWALSDCWYTCLRKCACHKYFVEFKYLVRYLKNFCYTALKVWSRQHSSIGWQSSLTWC